MDNYDTHKYDDIINLPHHQSETRPHMSVSDRAAQFGAFAALTGYDEAVKETARYTDEKIEPDEYEKERLNYKLSFIMEHLGEDLSVSVTYFRADSRKKGGLYVTAKGKIKHFNEYEKIIIMDDDREISINDILNIEIN